MGLRGRWGVAGGGWGDDEILVIAIDAAALQHREST
jgi:hypothetical protein